jgi:type IV pilus assembly protein PilA
LLAADAAGIPEARVRSLTVDVVVGTVFLFRVTALADPVSVSHYRRRVAEDRGFSLIELLVVILVVGVLAAIALPAFMVSRAKAGDAPAKELMHTAQVATETAALDAGGSYAGITAALLHRYEPTISPTKTSTDAYLSTVKTAATTYTLTVTSVVTGNKFTLARNANGTVARSCTIPSKTSTHGGCESVSGTKGSW